LRVITATSPWTLYSAVMLCFLEKIDEARKERSFYFEF